MKTQKSQIYGQIFIYILTLVLISFILVYGYNSIQIFKDRADKVSCLKLKNDLSNAVEGMISDFGSVKIKEFQLCAGYTSICLVESFESPAIPDNTDPIIKDSILSGTGKNVFLLEDAAKESFYAGKISVEPDVLCIKTSNNKIRLKLEGRGNRVLLSKHEE